MTTFTPERQIALPWLARLRWIAVVGQVLATAMAVLWLELALPLPWIALLIIVTMLTNLTLQIWHILHNPPDWVIPAIILLDVGVFTVLIGLTGGTANPFCVLYVVHVAMAVVMLGSGWAWFVVALSAVCYAAIFVWHVPLSRPLSEELWRLGQWCSLTLVTALIAYFIGRVNRSLRQREQELVGAREQARRSEHLAALTTLAAGAAHELGTPLGTVALVAKEIERSVDPASLTADDARLIRQEVDRCREILDRMRVDVIEDSDQRTSVATLEQLLEMLRKDLRPQEEERLAIETAEPTGQMVSRPRVLRRAVGVLLRNAFDASPPDGAVRLLFSRATGRMIFQVTDSGPGMSEHVLRRAGEPFFTTKAPGEGMGLGLFLVRLAAETYGGKFELQSAPGEGTRSIFEIPERQVDRGSATDLSSAEAKAIDVKREDPGSGRRSDVPDPAGQGTVEPRV